jgi:hypothetical protein
MEIVPVETILGEEGLLAPSLNFLVPNEENYSVLLIQPKGEIEVSDGGVRNRNRELAAAQFGQFLEEANVAQPQPDLVVTPEYSMPWDTLISALKAGKGPKTGKLWALGCESIKFNELRALKTELAEIATVLFEPLTAQPARFTDPLVYVFLASPNAGGGPARTVLLVQFKTRSMGHPEDFEVNNLHKGSKVFRFGNAGEGIRLTSLICSDALDFDGALAKAIYDRTLIVHVQLNPKPREPKFRGYRDRLLELSGERTEILSLNWAMNVSVYRDGQEKQWNNISASAWYLKPDKFDDHDGTLSGNHQRGLYYTWCEPIHSHALFFNFAPGIFVITASKVIRTGIPAVTDRRRGPQLTKTCVWDNGAAAWRQQDRAPDGFDGIVDEGGLAKDRLQEISNENPFAVERILALCAGEIEFGGGWYDVRELDSCRINQTETIQRMTFCQDPDAGARRVRTRRLMRCAEVWKILLDEPLLPAIADLKAGFRLEWLPDTPHQNVTSSAGSRATVMYLSDDASETDIKKAFTTTLKNLLKASSTLEEAKKAQERLALWYMRDGKRIQYEPYFFTKIDKAGTNSMVDFTRPA